MSPASGDNTINSLLVDRIYASFHSINVPSEWGLPMSVHLQDVPTTVSIQLMSPASGDPSILNPYPVKCPETVSEGQEKKW